MSGGPTHPAEPFSGVLENHQDRKLLSPESCPHSFFTYLPSPQATVTSALSHRLGKPHHPNPRQGRPQHVPRHPISKRTPFASPCGTLGRRFGAFWQYLQDKA